MRLLGKSIVVTGASSGMGRAIVTLFVNEGANVVAVARRKERLDELAKSLADAKGKIVVCQGDVSKLEDNEKMLELAVSEFGKLDVLVNNAGVAPRERKDILDITPDDFDYLTDINLKGTFFVTQSFVPLLIKNKKSRIVNISSMSAYTASVNRGEYCISKAGISMITKLFAARLAEYGVSVIEIRPGIIETDMTAVVKEKYEQLIADGLTPIKRMGTGEDVAKCVVSVAKGNFDFCTGTVIDCDGGFNVRRL